MALLLPNTIFHSNLGRICYQKKLFSLEKVFPFNSTSDLKKMGGGKDYFPLSSGMIYVVPLLSCHATFQRANVLIEMKEDQL